MSVVGPRPPGLCAALLCALASVLGAVAPAAAAPIEVRTARGIEGVLAAGGIDVAVVEVRSGADVALAGTVEVGGRTYPVALAARGVASVTVAARLPSGASAVTALPVRIRIGGGDVEAEVPGARVVARPLVVIGDAPAALLAAIEPWRRSQDLGEPVVVTPGRVPAAWPVMIGVGAVVLDRPAAELAAPAARAARRYLAAGGRVCRLLGEDAAPTCVQADAAPVPRTRVRARLAPVMGGWGWLALALAGGLGLVLALPRRRGTAAAVVLGLAVLAPSLGAVRKPDSLLAARGVRADAGAGEEWVAAELGVSDLAGGVDLGPGLWIEPTGADGGGPLDDVGLRGRLAGAGSWRLRGFVPAGTGGWADGLTRHPRPLPELP